MDTAELRTNIGINNVSDTLASVMVRLISHQGTELGAMPVTVMPRGMTQINQVVRQLLNRESVTNVEGYIRLESSQPILAWASQIDNATDDPGFAVSKGRGASKLLVQSTANVGNFKSSLVVVNLGNAAASRRYRRSQHPRNGSGRAERPNHSARRVHQLCQHSAKAWGPSTVSAPLRSSRPTGNRFWQPRGSTASPAPAASLKPGFGIVS